MLKWPGTGEDYVKAQGWLNATLDRCPVHPQGGCGFARHGTYPRVCPPGTRIARWYCPKAGQTYSLLPECFNAGWSGELAEVEQIVLIAEQARSREACAQTIRTEIELPGAMRFIDRRVKTVRQTLHLVKGLRPDLFSQVEPTVGDFKFALGCIDVLRSLRQLFPLLTPSLPVPVGFNRRIRPARSPPVGTNTA